MQEHHVAEGGSMDRSQEHSTVTVLHAEPNHHCLALDVVGVLLNRTTLDEVAQYLVLQAFADETPWQATIYEVGPDSLLRLAGTFGLADGRGDLHEHSCLDDPVLGRSLRGEVLHRADVSSSTATASQEPRLDGHQVIWPLMTPSRLTGVLQIRFHDEPDLNSVTERLTELTPPIALALDLSAVHGARRRLGGAANSHSRSNTDGELTARQREVLRYMAQGMTNGQIARVLKFSESTVRQETMAIYRTLQVRGRAEAVQFAEDTGLLQPAAAAV